MVKHIAIFIVLLLAAPACLSQTGIEIPEGENPKQWEADIAAFEEESRQNPLPEDAAVFVGSSSIRLWSSLKEDMSPIPVIQRGFGGSKLFDAIYYVDRIIIPYDPKALVVFSGSNDIAGESPKSADQVVQLYRQFVETVHKKLPDLPIYYIAISPTKSRWEHREIVFETNKQIAEIASQDDRLFFIDTASALLNDQGEPEDAYFIEDNLHLSEEGYRVWTSIIKPVLLQAWDK